MSALHIQYVSAFYNLQQIQLDRLETTPHLVIKYALVSIAYICIISKLLIGVHRAKAFNF